MARIGDLGFKLHTGRSRNEQIATDLRLYVREKCSAIAGHLADWSRAFTVQAQAAGDAVMPAYTHLQRAEPVLVAHWLQAYGEMLLRDMTRLGDLSRRLNYCPLGSGAVAGATLKLDRTIAARELGFCGPTANSMDATSDRDFALEFLQALTLIAVARQPLCGGDHTVRHGGVRVRRAAGSLFHRVERDAAEEES